MKFTSTILFFLPILCCSQSLDTLRYIDEDGTDTLGFSITVDEAFGTPTAANVEVKIMGKVVTPPANQDFYLFIIDKDTIIRQEGQYRFVAGPRGAGMFISGSFVSYFEDGKRASSGEYHYTETIDYPPYVPCCHWEFYDKEGNIIKTEDYSKNSKREVYFKEGVADKEITYKKGRKKVISLN